MYHIYHNTRSVILPVAQDVCSKDSYETNWVTVDQASKTVCGVGSAHE